MIMQINTRGFTLLEILIALAIFSILALLATNGLYLVMEHYQHTRARFVQFTALQTTQAILFRDITQIIDRPINSESAWLMPVESHTTADLALTRGGAYQGLFSQTSQLQRVSYTVQGHTLYRQTWTLPSHVATQQVLLTNVQHFKLQFLDQQQQFQDHWPIDTQQRIPRAIAVSLAIINQGNIQWLWIVPAQEMQYAAK